MKSKTNVAASSGYLDRPVRNFISLHGILGPPEPLWVWHPYHRKKIMRLYRSTSASVDTLLAEMGLECLDWSKDEKARIGKMLGIPVTNVQPHPRRELKPEFKKDVTRRWMERLVRFSSFFGRCVLMGIVTLIFVLLVSGIAGIAIGLLEAALGIP
jgi:hypothetical protein